VTVFKAGFPEVVRLQNTSTSSVNLDGWRMCSIKGNQEHTGVGGMLEPGETRDYPYTGSGPIWNNTERDDGALYTPDGRLVSYWTDPTQ
jgi:micrococcal nuclease